MSGRTVPRRSIFILYLIQLKSKFVIKPFAPICSEYWKNTGGRWLHYRCDKYVYVMSLFPLVHNDKWSNCSVGQSKRETCYSFILTENCYNLKFHYSHKTVIVNYCWRSFGYFGSLFLRWVCWISRSSCDELFELSNFTNQWQLTTSKPDIQSLSTIKN